MTQQKIIGIPQVYSFSLKFEVHSFFGSLNVYVKERANTFQFASLGRKADSLLSAQNKPKTEAHPYVGLPPNCRRSEGSDGRLKADCQDTIQHPPLKLTGGS